MSARSGPCYTLWPHQYTNHCRLQCVDRLRLIFHLCYHEIQSRLSDVGFEPVRDTLLPHDHLVLLLSEETVKTSINFRRPNLYSLFTFVRPLLNDPSYWILFIYPFIFQGTSRTSKWRFFSLHYFFYRGAHK